MTRNTEVLEAIKEVVCEVLDVSPELVIPTARFREDLGAESLDLISIVTEIEEKYDTDISIEDAQAMATVSHAIEFVTRLMDTQEEAS